MPNAAPFIYRGEATREISFPQEFSHRLRATAHMQLLINTPDVIAHRVNAHPQLIRNLFISKTFSKSI